MKKVLFFPFLLSSTGKITFSRIFVVYIIMCGCKEKVDVPAAAA